MAPPPIEPPQQQHNIPNFTNLLSFFNPNNTPPFLPNSISIPIPIPIPIQLTESTRSPFDSSTRPDNTASSKPTIKSGVSPAAANGFPSTVRISGLNLNGKGGGGPAFVGQVFSMCDLSGTGLMAVSTHFDIPFISKRTPEWLKKMFASITKSKKNNGPVFRFFMDLGDAVSYVKQLNIPSGVVGACRLDLAYEHFKEKPHLFQFVPNEKQVKAANELLRTIPQNDGKKKVDGVPVFGAQNLDIAIATSDGIKWYTPYFFDKKMLDNILEESVDQHFQGLIKTRHMQRQNDVIDDNLGAETSDIIEEMGDSWEPPEMQDLMDEVGHPSIPLSIIAKAAEIQLHYATDRLLLGNRWLRKATGIQPKFPYLVDSFEKRSRAAFLKASKSSISVETDSSSSDLMLADNAQQAKRKGLNFQFPFGDWSNFPLPWLNQGQQPHDKSTKRLDATESVNHNSRPDPFLPKVTMVGISSPEAGQLTKANVKKSMENFTRQLEEMDHGNDNKSSGSGNSEVKVEDRDPLFVANVGDYYSSLAKTGSARWVRGGN
ncbi:hypothetical protein ACFE04_028579 [Oxalis oulophora]